jgi:hypothetical protein
VVNAAQSLKAKALQLPLLYVNFISPGPQKEQNTSLVSGLKSPPSKKKKKPKKHCKGFDDE